MSYFNQPTNKLSLVNSTTATLSAGASFSGQWEDVLTYNSTMVAVKSDKDGEYIIQFSPDGINIDSSLTRYYKVGRIEPPHRYTITRRYVRVKYNNGTASQSEFRMQVMHGEKESLNTTTDSIMAQDFDSISVRPTNFNYEVALNRRQGYTTWNKWGYNQDIDSDQTETIWSVGGLFYGLTTSGTLYLTSTSANDHAAGSGARSIIVYGIDSDRISQLEVIPLNGLSAATSSLSWLGINRLSLYLTGASASNRGNINAHVLGATQAQIPATQGSTQQSFFFTQRDHIALIDWMLINCVRITGGGSDPVVTIKGWVTSLVSGARYEIFRHIIDTGIENTVELRPQQPFPVGEKSLVSFEATTTQNNTSISLRFSLIEVRDADG